MLAFAVRQGGYSMGVMVTASHNPPRDNGYKVYLGGANGGSQIISPVDSQIAAHIDAVANELTFDEIAKSTAFETGGGALRAWYVAHTSGLVAPQPDQQIRIVFTAMHGVGWATARSVFEAAGLHDPILVNQQIEPDGSFPTVAFPNPEEPGALDLAIGTANLSRADLILACDPDADRLAVAVPDSAQANGWRKLTGDQVGLILGTEIAAKAARAGVTGNLGSSIVSSSQLSAVAAHYGLGYAQTLTGFKWISKVPNLLFGFEEALGYCVDSNHTPDKDGISAALLIADLANRLHNRGLTLDQHLAVLGQQFGHYATGQISLRFATVAVAQDMVARLRQSPPTQIDGEPANFTDLALGTAELPATDGLRFDLPDGRRVIIRPSGTEPKLKCYLQAVGTSAVDAGEKLVSLDSSMRALLG
jgi:phosphomannomutase